MRRDAPWMAPTAVKRGDSKHDRLPETVAALAERGRLIVEIIDRHYPGLLFAVQAAMLHRDLLRYATKTLPLTYEDPPQFGEPLAHGLAPALRFGHVGSTRSRRHTPHWGRIRQQQAAVQDGSEPWARARSFAAIAFVCVLSRLGTFLAEEFGEHRDLAPPCREGLEARHVFRPT